MEHQKIYLIIVTYNAMKWAEKCFSSLRKSSVPVHTMVVDNGSTDGTQEFNKTHFPEVEFIQSAENLGFGKANNLGIEKLPFRNKTIQPGTITAHFNQWKYFPRNEFSHSKKNLARLFAFTKNRFHPYS